MRLEKAWIVATKELAEFKSNKYIIFTLLFVPLLLSILLPLTTFSSIAALAPSDEPLPLNPVVTNTMVGDAIVGAVLVNYSVEDSIIRESVIRGSIIRNSTLVGVNVEGSILEGVTIQNSLVQGSNIIDPIRVERTSLVESAVLGNRGEEFTSTMVTLLNSFLLFFIIIPAAIPAVIASYSFVGEKVSKSLEPLLATPTTDGELLLGKSLSIFLPTMAATWMAAVLFIWLTNMVVTPILGYVPLPTVEWILGILLLAPLFCVLSITANVLISSRVSDVRASQQLGTLVVLPAILLFMGVMIGLLAFGISQLLLFVLVVLSVDVGMGYTALKVFQREEILVSWK
ncbi:MAG: ABC transporter permease subunit [Thermoplasmata archaeon]